MEETTVYYPLEIIRSTAIYRTLTWPQTDPVIKADISGFNVWYKEQKADIPIKLNDALLTTNFFVHNISNYTMVPSGFYQLEIVTPKGTVKSDFTSNVPKPDKYANTMILKSMFNLIGGPGNIPCFLYSKKMFGTRCDCAPPGQSAYAWNCMKCYGQGFVGGYHAPILIFIDFLSTENRSKSQGQFGVFEQNRSAFTTCVGFGFPREYDVIREVSAPQVAYTVQGTQVIKYNSYPIDIQGAIKQLESGHPIYKIPLPTIDYLPDKVQYLRRLSDGTVITIKDYYDKMVSSIH